MTSGVSRASTMAISPVMTRQWRAPGRAARSWRRGRGWRGHRQGAAARIRRVPRARRPSEHRATESQGSQECIAISPNDAACPSMERLVVLRVSRRKARRAAGDRAGCPDAARLGDLRVPQGRRCGPLAAGAPGIGRPGSWGSWEGVASRRWRWCAPERRESGGSPGRALRAVGDGGRARAEGDRGSGGIPPGKALRAVGEGVKNA
jgi:hypothetical protein